MSKRERERESFRRLITHSVHGVCCRGACDEDDDDDDDDDRPVMSEGGPPVSSF